MEQVDSVREGINSGLTLRGAFFTHWQNREAFVQARKSLEDSGICHVFQTVVSYNPKAPESTLEEMPLCAFAPRSWAAVQYKKLTAEYWPWLRIFPRSLPRPVPLGQASISDGYSRRSPWTAEASFRTGRARRGL